MPFYSMSCTQAFFKASQQVFFKTYIMLLHLLHCLVVIMPFYNMSCTQAFFKARRQVFFKTCIMHYLKFTPSLMPTLQLSTKSNISLPAQYHRSFTLGIFVNSSSTFSKGTSHTTNKNMTFGNLLCKMSF